MAYMYIRTQAGKLKAAEEGKTKRLKHRRIDDWCVPGVAYFPTTSEHSSLEIHMSSRLSTCKRSTVFV